MEFVYTLSGVQLVRGRRRTIIVLPLQDASVATVWWLSINVDTNNNLFIFNILFLFKLLVLYSGLKYQIVKTKNNVLCFNYMTTHETRK